MACDQDFKTIADFRKDNRHAFKLVFRQFVLLCRNWTCSDGLWIRLKAVNSTDRRCLKNGPDRVETLWRVALTVYQSRGAVAISGRRMTNRQLHEGVR